MTSLVLGGCAKPLNSDGESGGAEARRQAVLAVGSELSPFALPDQKGRMVTRDEVLASGGAVVIALPSLDSPAARPAIDWTRRNASMLRQQGKTEVLFVTADSVERNDANAAIAEMRVAVLSDPAGVLLGPMGLADGGLGFAVMGDDARVHVMRTTLMPPAEILTALVERPGKEKQKGLFGGLP